MYSKTRKAAGRPLFNVGEALKRVGRGWRLGGKKHIYARTILFVNMGRRELVGGFAQKGGGEVNQGQEESRSWEKL